jgi:hypothetical protein
LRNASLVPAERLPSCSCNAISGEKPVITSLAGFELFELAVPEEVAFAQGLLRMERSVRRQIESDLSA